MNSPLKIYPFKIKPSLWRSESGLFFFVSLHLFGLTTVAMLTHVSLPRKSMKSLKKKTLLKHNPLLSFPFRKLQTLIFFRQITKSMVKEQLLFHARTVICLHVLPATNIMSQVIVYHYDGVSLPHRFYTKSVSKSWGALPHMSKS